MWPLKKKEPVKKWGEWQELKKCGDCDRLQKPFYFDFKHGVCPACGSKNIEVVVARWEESTKSVGFMCERVLHRSEIRI
ncbi:MAG: hypothetical protein KQH63_16270 [Desulfobulbaceae bacterium]|nr:hypothetical protein [Desulfobulbaceae bacterium]